MVINTDLTETKIAFEEMRRAEADARARASELEAILDAIPGATFIARDASCQTMTSSRAAYELLRLPPGANTSKSAPSIERPTSFQLVRNGREVEPAQLPVQQAAATGKPVINSELTIVFADGTSRDVLGNAVPLLNEDGTTRGAIGSFIDITERNAAIQSARRQEAILQSVLHDTSDFIFLKDSEGRYLAINPAGAKAAGKLPEDFLGKTDWEVFPVEVAEQHAKRDRAVLDSGKCASFEDHILYDGEMRHIQTLKNVCRDADGHVIGVVGITRDVTDQKLKEKQLAMSESRYRALIEANASIVWTASARGSRNEDAPGLCALTGQTREEFADRAGGRRFIRTIWSVRSEYGRSTWQVVSPWRCSIVSDGAMKPTERC